MAAAVEEFKVQAIAKAERDAAALDAQNKASAAGRRAELIRFADEFEANVGSIVANVSASAVQLEASAGTLTRTAETTQDLSGQAAGASEQASSNMQSIASATEELSASVDEIGRQAQESNRIAEAAVLQAQQTDGRIGKLSRAAQEIGDVVKADYGDCRADQSSGAQCHHRGGPRRRCRSRFRRRRFRGQVARQPDCQGDRRDFDAHCRHAGRHAGIGCRDQGNRRDHRSDIEHRFDRSRAPSRSKARPRRKLHAACKMLPKGLVRPPRISWRSTAGPRRPALHRPTFWMRRVRCLLKAAGCAKSSTALWPIFAPPRTLHLVFAELPFQFDLGLVQARPLRRRRFLWLSHVERPLVFAPTSGMAIGSSSRECVELGTRTGVNASASAPLSEVRAPLPHPLRPNFGRH